MEVGEKITITTAQNSGETIRTARKTPPELAEVEGEIANSLAAGEAVRAVHFLEVESVAGEGLPGGW